jgi:hypothetical protein
MLHAHLYILNLDTVEPMLFVDDHNDSMVKTSVAIRSGSASSAPHPQAPIWQVSVPANDIQCSHTKIRNVYLSDDAQRRMVPRFRMDNMYTCYAAFPTPLGPNIDSSVV